MNIFQSINNKKEGFTLIEMIVAISLFTIVMVSAMGALVSMIDANRKAQSLRTVMDNLNFALESMTRGMRVGIDYHCGSIGDINVPRDCAIDGDTFMSFTNSDGNRIIFRLNKMRLLHHERNAQTQGFLKQQLVDQQQKQEQ